MAQSKYDAIVQAFVEAIAGTGAPRAAAVDRANAMLVALDTLIMEEGPMIRNTVHRHRLRRMAVGPLAIALLVTGCSSSGGDSQGTTGSDADPNGTVRVAAVLNSTGGAQFDPVSSQQSLDDDWMRALYGTLLQEEPDGSLRPYLAESFKVINPQTIQINLRPDMKFSDGQPFDGTAVRKALLRSLNEPANPAVAASRTPGFRQLEDVEVVSSKEVLIKLKKPVAGEFALSLANPREGAIPSPSAPTSSYPDVKPVGAGPFTLERFVPNQSILMKKSPTFFDADNVKLGGIEWLQTLPGPTQTTALLSKNLDFGQVPAADLPTVKANSSYSTKSIASEVDYSYLNLCATRPPLNDPKVRRALSLAIDRQQLNELWQGGDADTQLSYWPTRSLVTNSALKDSVKHDPAEAKRLLQEAGATNLTLDLYWSQSQPYTQPAEILQAQLAAVGIKLTLNPLQDTVSEFIQPQKPGMMIAKSTRLVEAQMGATMTGGLTTLCGITHPDIASLLSQAAELNRTDPEAIKIYQQINTIVTDNSWIIFLTTQPKNWTWNKQAIGGDPVFLSLTGEMDFTSFYIKKR